MPMSSREQDMPGDILLRGQFAILPLALTPKRFSVRHGANEVGHAKLGGGGTIHPAMDVINSSAF